MHRRNRNYGIMCIKERIKNLTISISELKAIGYNKLASWQQKQLEELKVEAEKDNEK